MQQLKEWSRSESKQDQSKTILIIISFERKSVHAVFCMHGSYVALDISTNSSQAEEVLQEVQ